MAFPTSRQVRWVIKPLWFLACLAPFIWMNLQAFKYVDSDLGEDPIVATQQYMGIWALRLLLLTLAISPLRQLTGQIWLLRLRRMTGLFALFYASMHLLNYVGADQQLDWPAMLADVLGLTSTAGWQRRLGTRWGALHRLIYPITLLVAVHFWWQTEDNFLEPALYSIVIAVLLGYRWLRSRNARGGSVVAR